MIASADLVARIRRATGDTQEGLARRLAVLFPTINAWERGRSEPSAKNRSALEALAAELDIVTSRRHGDRRRSRHSCSRRAAATEFGGAVSVHSAANGWEGLVTCGAVKPRLLFLDIMMPGIDGLDVARRLPAIPYLADLRGFHAAAFRRSERSARAPLRRLVRHRQHGHERQHMGNEAGGTRCPCQSRAHVGGRPVRRRRLSHALERHRGAPGVHASDRHDESADPCRLAGARRRSGAASAVHRPRREKRNASR